MSDAFRRRMAELDAVVAQCADRDPFATGIVRDASNRSGRDWPWWGVRIQRTCRDGSLSRRVTATVTLNATEQGDPGAFEATWCAQVWRGVGTDTFRQAGSRPLEWVVPTASMLQDAMADLLRKAEASLPPSG